MSDYSPTPETDNTPTPEPEAGEPIVTRYSLAECRDNARAAFGVQPEVVMGAFALAGLTEATRAEAEAAIKKYLRREV